MRNIQFVPFAGLDAITLAADRPAPGRLFADLAHPSEWVARVGADRAAAMLAATAMWCLAAWIAVGLLAALATAAPGAAGRLADRVARGLLPRALYRIAAGAAGLGVVLAPVAAGAAPPIGTTSNSPAWPSDAPLPAPSWPVTAAPHQGARPPASRATPPEPAPARPRTVVVAPGDSLWSIAADHLPAGTSRARVARSWPRWYGANRAVIGADPDLIHPGQVLQVPSGSEEDHR